MSTLAPKTLIYSSVLDLSEYFTGTSAATALCKISQIIKLSLFPEQEIIFALEHFYCELAGPSVSYMVYFNCLTWYLSGSAQYFWPPFSNHLTPA